MAYFIRNFLDAWVAWYHASEPISHFELWGLRVLVWGRIGKSLEFFGAVFFVVDWIGRERLHDSLEIADKTVAKFQFARLLPNWDRVRTAVRLGIWILGNESRVRVLNLLVILLGFMFDFLAS